MKPEALSQTLTKMQKETEEGKLNWRMEVQTTEGGEEKYTVDEDGESWTVDECYVSYRCHYNGKDFCMITYEMIKTLGAQIRTVNYIFLPPPGICLFSLHTLLKHSIEANSILISQVRSLWELLIKLVKQESAQVDFHIAQAEVSVEEDRL